jgi:hypothetical protein
VCSLIVFAYLLTLIETEAAGRAYATYGGIYIVASIAWLWVVESVRPDRSDVSGACLCLMAQPSFCGGRAVGGVTYWHFSDMAKFPALVRNALQSRPRRGWCSMATSAAESRLRMGDRSRGLGELPTLQCC